MFDDFGEAPITKTKDLQDNEDNQSIMGIQPAAEAFADLVNVEVPLPLGLEQMVRFF